MQSINTLIKLDTGLQDNKSNLNFLRSSSNILCSRGTVLLLASYYHIYCKSYINKITIPTVGKQNVFNCTIMF